MFILMMMMFISIFISMSLLIINLLVSMNIKKSYEKNSPFECGFAPQSPARLPFSIHFYLIGIIFLIFDVEIIIFFPMIPQTEMDMWSKTFIYFIVILLTGLYMEWYDGALKWVK